MPRAPGSCAAARRPARRGADAAATACARAPSCAGPARAARTRPRRRAARARHDRAGGAPVLHVRPDAHRVVGVAQHEAARRGRSPRSPARRACRRWPGRAGRTPAARRCRAPPCAAARSMLDRTGVEPAGDVASLVPVLGEQEQPGHRRTAVDNARDAHAVVQRVRLAADDVHLAVGVGAADLLGGGDPGDAVADDDHTPRDRSRRAHGDSARRTRRPLPCEARRCACPARR